jgi:threonine dehydrogenase-like Zn-dependent dehydrogenase
MIAVHLEDGRVEVRKKARPRRREGFAVLRLIYGGICNTDLELRRGYYGFRGTPGHEFVAEVVEAETRALVGKRVVGEINLACGVCEWCRAGRRRHCPRRTVLGIVKHPGAFSEFFTLPERNLHVVPKGVSDEEAVFTEPIAAACEILDQVKFARGAEVGVLGDGKLGLLIAQVLQASGLRVVLFGRHEEKLRLARKAGVETVVAKKLPKARFDYTVEATGSAGALQDAVAMTRALGTVVMKSTVHGKVSLDTAPVIVDELTLMGSRCGRMEPALELLKKKKVKVRAMISDVMPLKEAPRAFDRAKEKGVLKVLLANR